jgi:hypothetical protein
MPGILKSDKTASGACPGIAASARPPSLNGSTVQSVSSASARDNDSVTSESSSTT